MTYNPFDELQILTPFRYNFAHEQPSHTITSASGGGNVDFSYSGVDVNPGTTTGDRASIGVANHPEIDHGILEAYIWYSLSGDTDFTNEYRMGFNFPDPNDTARQVCLDFTNQQYSVGGTTEPFGISLVQYGWGYVKIVVDQNSGTTEFAHHMGDDSETVSIPDSDRAEDRLMATESNGASESAPQIMGAVINYDHING